jgi:4-carboxymuconolactone decarboxylase
MKRIAVMIATLSLVTTSWAQGDRTENGRKPMQTANDISMVAPALQKYAQGPLAELWKRPGLTPRDRSIVTIAALIARNQTIEMPHYFNLALDNGVKPREISEIITHLAFYSGWANAMSAVAVAKDVFAERKIGADQLPPASPALLPLDKDAEANAQRLWNSSSATSLRASCSTPPTFCFAICGFVRTLRPEIAVSSRSVP